MCTQCVCSCVLFEIKLLLYHAFKGKGISFAIYGTLKGYFGSAKTPNFEEAKAYIKSKKKNWDLSKEDFEEAKKEFRKK